MSGLTPTKPNVGARRPAWLPTRALLSTRILELRTRTGLMTAVLLLILGIPALVLAIRLLVHAIDPSQYGPAGSLSVFRQLADLMGQFGFIAAATLGASAATTDLTEGMFRNLVITGRSRLALYLARIPAGLAVLAPVVATAFTVICLVTSYAGTPSTPLATNPAAGEMAKVGAWVLLEITIGCLVGLGLGSLTGQRTVTVILLIALEIIVTPILSMNAIPHFLNGQRLIVGVAMEQLRPAVLATAGAVRHGPHGPLLGRTNLSIPPMPTWAMVSVIVGWIVGWSVVGAWRMETRDA